MLQRVGLAQALVNDPEIVFLDEPMSGLDPVGRREVRDLLASLRAQGTTVFMCSHILSDIEALCDRVAIMRSGHLAAAGRLEELRQQAGENSGFEILATQVAADMIVKFLPSRDDFSVTQTSSGARIEVNDERKVDEALAALRRAGGRLLSVQPIGQSLEDFFVRELSNDQKNGDGAAY
jgi:ABC-2 type transport system ATP-binding protein